VVELAQQWVAPLKFGVAASTGVTAPTGASKMNHLEDAPSALEIELTEEECREQVVVQSIGLEPTID